MPFANRSEAGRRLAVALAGYKEQEPTVLALPRGGVPGAAEVAAALDAPLDLILVRKVGVPFQPELAMGAVVDGSGSIIVRNEDVIEHIGIAEAAFKAVCDSVNAAFDQGCWRRRPRSSTAAASSFAPIARAPSSPRTAIPLKRNRRRRSAAAAPARAGRAAARRRSLKAPRRIPRPPPAKG